MTFDLHATKWFVLLNALIIENLGQEMCLTENLPASFFQQIWAVLHTTDAMSSYLF